MCETRPLRPDETGTTHTRIMRETDLEAVTRLYWSAFPERVERLGREGPARAWLRDQLQLLLCCHPDTSLVAEREGRFAGFLFLTFPRGRAVASANASQLRRRQLGRALRGAYGLPLRAAIDAARSRLGAVLGDLPLQSTPHVAAIAVDPGFRRCGIGSALMARARALCSGTFRAIWLNVEPHQAAAISFYEGLGFRCVGRGSGVQRMWLDLSSGREAPPR